MAITNKEIMAEARGRLKGKWGAVVLVSFVYFLVAVVPGSIPKIGWLFGLVLGGPLAFGIAWYYLAFVRGKSPILEDLFKGFSLFGKTLVTYLLMIVFVVLWMLLLIVPGIIAGLSYSMTFYILIDNPGLSAREAIAKSKALMQGNKYRYFCLGCRFIGWGLLGILSLGIGFLWIIPYFMASSAKFYETLINTSETKTAA